jgi:hypothetical protein
MLLFLSVVCISGISSDMMEDVTAESVELPITDFALCQTSNDTDGDNLSDSDETDVYGTDWRNPDTDGDGCPDGWEVSRGLDPLEWTWETGQATEFFMTYAILPVAVFLIALVGLILTAYFGMNNRILHKFRSRILLIPAILFLLAILMVFPVEVYGTTDPGSNVMSRESSSSSESMMYTVQDSGWFGDTITISASYYATYSNARLNVYITVRRGATTIGSYELLLGGGYLGQEKTDSVTLNLEPDLYDIRRTYTYQDTFGYDLGDQTHRVTVTQSERDGLNMDQISWSTTKLVLLAGGFGAILVGIFLKTHSINQRAEKSKTTFVVEDS